MIYFLMYGNYCLGSLFVTIIIFYVVYFEINGGRFSCCLGLARSSRRELKSPIFPVLFGPFGVLDGF